MKNVLFSALAAIAMLTIACNNLDENLTDSMATELEARQKRITDYLARNQVIAEFNSTTQYAPVSLINDASTGFATVKDNVNMIANKNQATIEVYNEYIARLVQLQQDYRNRKLKTEEAKQELESINSNFKAVDTTFERVDEFFKKFSAEYTTILNTWLSSHPEEATVMKEAASNPVKGLSATAPGTLQTAPSTAKEDNMKGETKKQ